MSTRPSPFQTTVTATELGQKTGRVIDKAQAGIVGIEKHGEVRAVMMSLETYERLVGGADDFAAMRASDVPPALADAMRDSLSDWLEDPRD